MAGGRLRHPRWRSILWIATSFENFQILNFARVAADAVAILGLMIIIGYSGQVSIGQSFFFGLGAYVTAWLGVDHGLAVPAHPAGVGRARAG